MEILHAKVERRETIEWEQLEMPTLVVVLSSDAGSGLTNSSSERGRCWVADDGRVLRQELSFSQRRSRLTVLRCSAPGSRSESTGRRDEYAPVVANGAWRALITDNRS